MSELFGTDGVRGIAGEYPLDFPTVYKLGKAVVRSGKRSILIGRDTRASGLWIEKALQQAILSEGGEVTLADVITTPGVAILSRNVPFDTGIVVSASHNPYQDNGIKMFIPLPAVALFLSAVRLESVRPLPGRKQFSAKPSVSEVHLDCA